MKKTSTTQLFIMFGIIATVLSIILNIPALGKIITTHNTSALSLSSYIVFISSNIFWGLYGYYFKSTSLMISSTISIFLQIIIVYYIFKNNSLSSKDYKEQHIKNIDHLYKYRYL